MAALRSDPAELFSVFEVRPDQDAGQDTMASPETVGQPETDPTFEMAATNEMAVAFAALQVELTGLLARTAKVRANEERREDNSSTQRDVFADKADHLHEEAAAAMTSSSAALDKTEPLIPTPTNETVVETLRKRSWWRRLVR